MVVTADNSPADGNGAITDNLSGEDGTSINIRGNRLALRAATGIGSANDLETAVSTVAASNTSSGNIQVDNYVGGLLTIGAFDGVTGITNSAAAGTVVVTNFQAPLTVANNVTSGGAVTLTATDAATAGQDLLVNAGVTVRSINATVTLNAGDDATLPAGSLVTAGATGAGSR